MTSASPRLEQALEHRSWPATLALSTVTGTLATACMMPFVGLAVVAAATMRGRAAVLALITAWATNQLLGFALLGYPVTAYAFVWGAALGLASLLALGVARLAVRAEAGVIVPRVLAGFVLAFAAYELSLFAFAHIAGGLDTFTPAIVAKIGMNDAAWCAGLLAFRFALARIAPAWFGRAPQLRFA